MNRFFCPSRNIKGPDIIIDDVSTVHHLKDVLRIKEGMVLEIFDEKGNIYQCLAENLGDKVSLKAVKKLEARANEIRITVACAIPKRAKMDEIVDKLTQLGVEKIVPLETARVIVRLNNAKRILRQKRWEKIAVSAAQQSKRQNIPVVEQVKGMKEVLAEAESYDLKIIPTLAGTRVSIKDTLNVKPRNILIFIGPEGDFTDEEVYLAKKSGCVSVSLGENVLRVDTAAIAVVSFIKLNENH